MIGRYFGAGHRSVERRLNRMLLTVILSTGLIAGCASFLLAYVDAQDLQDDMLRQVATLVDRSPGASSAGSESQLSDPGTRVIVIRLAPDARSAWLPADLSSGLHTVATADGTWRVYVGETSAAGKIAVAQSTEVRNEIAMDRTLGTLVPLMLLLPVLAWLAARIVRHELAPVRELAHALDRQAAERPEPVNSANLPEEVAPFANAINRLLDRVGKLVVAQRRFVADAAHELRSPLTALSLQAQNLEQAPSLEALLERIAPLRAGIERARRLTDQLLSLARSQAADHEPRRIDVGPLIRELIAEHLPLAESRGIDLGIGRSQDLLALTADAELLRVVLKNALDNSLRYTPGGGEVTMHYFSEANDCVIEVTDTGPGIPESERERAFQPFRRLEDAAGEGSGLGLAIARDAAARLGGTIGLFEPSGGGLVFRYRQSFAGPPRRK